MAASNRLLYVRPLRRRERKKLERTAKRARDARLVNRARMILLSGRRKRLSEIADLLDVSAVSVARWIRRYEADGIDALHDRPRSGRPRKADEAYERRLIELVQTPPQSLDSGCPWSVWTVDRLIAWMVAEGFGEVSGDTVRRALHQNRFAFLRPKLDLKHKQDPEEVKAFKRRLRAVKKGWMPICA